MKRRISALLAFVLTAPLVLAAPPPRSAYIALQQWKASLHEANEKLQAGKWKKGRDIANSVLRKMRNRIASGDEASAQLLAVAILFRAIGEAGLGDSESATWDFGVAQELYPEYSRVDLKAYGEAGLAMEGWRYTNGSPSLPDLSALDEAAAANEVVTPPRKLEGDQPEYPLAKAKSCVQSSIVVKTVIDDQGRTQFPIIEPGADPVLALAAFEAIRTWRFVPAKLNGKPVQVFYALTVNFKLSRGCPPQR